MKDNRKLQYYPYLLHTLILSLKLEQTYQSCPTC